MKQGLLPGSGGTDIYFRRLGEDAHALVVPNSVWLAADLEDLAHDRSVVFYDPRGRGQSGAVADKTQISLESELEDMADVIRHCGLESVDLLGWSYHGGIAASYAARNPGKVRRLILAAPITPRKTPSGAEAERNLQSRLDMPAIMQVMQSRPTDPVEGCKAMAAVFFRAYFHNASAQARSLANPCEHANEWGQNLMPHINAFMSSLGDWDFRATAAQFPGPALILHGNEDFQPLAGAQEWQASFPNARLCVLPSAGHFPWLEKPELFATAVRDFLK